MARRSLVPRKNQRHIASIDFGKLYRPAFPSIKESRAFVARVNDVPKDRTKVLLHQVGRMVWLADQIDKVAYGRPALQIMFYMIAAEAAAKIFFEYEDEGQSKRHVFRFFEELCGPKQQTILGQALWHYNVGHPLPMADAIAFLYDVRCDVVHRGRYYNLHLPLPGEHYEFTGDWKGSVVILRFTLESIRESVLEGAVLACRRLHPTEK